MNNISGIIQARMGSVRLPDKTLLHLHGMAVIDWICRRAAMAKKISSLTAAIPDCAKDDVLEKHLNTTGVTVHRGSEENVLGRMHQVVVKEDPEHVVRICGDNPLICGELVDELIEFHICSGNDYSFNHIPRGNNFPDGLGAEICTRGTWEIIAARANTKPQREHVFNYLWDNYTMFKIGTYDNVMFSPGMNHLKLDLDDEKDYLRLMNLELNPQITAREIIQLFKNGKNEKR